MNDAFCVAKACHSETVTDVDTLKKHAGGMFLVSISAAMLP